MSYEINETPITFSEIKFPNTLYKYRNWIKPEHRTILTKREVFFAPPSSFKDPHDCKIPRRWDLLTDEDILNKYFQDSIEKNRHFACIEDHMEFAIGWANNTVVRNKEFVKEHQAKEFESYNARAGILSLTEFCMLKRMWKEYSEDHTGFCVGFDPAKMLKDKHIAGGKVRYVPDLPIIYPTPKHSSSLQMQLQAFSKLTDWEFEQEYRAYKFRYEPLTEHDRKEIIPQEAYKEIIIGAAMTPESRDELINSLPTELRHVRLKKARIDGEDIIIDDL